MGSLTLIRHAQASFGSADYDRLSELGHQQAAWLAAYFKSHHMRFDRVVRGDMRRHRETAEAILAHGLGPEAQVDPRFDEFDHGVLARNYRRAADDGPATFSRTEFLAVFPKALAGWAEGRLEGAEPFAGFEARVAAAVNDAVEARRDVMVVTSGGVIGMVLRQVLRLDLQATADLMLDIHNASIHRLNIEDGRLRLVLYNACPHLDPSDRGHARTYV